MIIELKGHLDTSKIPEAKKSIDAQLAGINPAEHIVIDCTELDYISSSGLRVLLVIKKMFSDMEVINVSNNVYSVFEVTGFTRIFDVRKALRKIDLTECELIGEGGNGAVYRINEEEIVKVSKHSRGEDTLVHESEQVREAFLMGIPTVISFDTVDCGDGRKGIVMEALNSQSLGAYLSANSDSMDEIVPKYVELFRQANSVEVETPLFRNTKEWLRSLINLPQRIVNEEEAAMLSGLLDEIPDSNHFVHFDGHAGNILMHGSQDDRSLMLIDFGDSGTGHPILEIAGWGFVMLEPDFGQGDDQQRKITGMSREVCQQFSRRILAEMFHTTDEVEIEDLLHKASLVARLKSAFVAQYWYAALPSGKFKTFMKKLVDETITLVPEIREAIRYFVNLVEAYN